VIKRDEGRLVCVQIGLFILFKGNTTLHKCVVFTVGVLPSRTPSTPSVKPLQKIRFELKIYSNSKVPATYLSLAANIISCTESN
jgi:hypothetical protein